MKIKDCTMTKEEALAFVKLLDKFIAKNGKPTEEQYYQLKYRFLHDVRSKNTEKSG